MAVTENTYTGDGTTVLYSFTFPYLVASDIKVSVGGTLTTAYTLSNATTVQFNTAPANGAAIRIYRKSSADALAATFFPGSAIRSQDLNNNFTQNLYVVQETDRDTTTALNTSNTALTTANAATTTANTASTTATNAVTSATAATATANSALGTANTASTTATTAATQAAAAVTTANTALNAVSQALNYTPVANVAAIPASPSNGNAVRVLDSTGIENFTPLSGRPAGFVGSSALNVEMYYSGTQSSWIWTRYMPNDPETRYIRSALASANILLGNGSGVATGVALTGDVSITNAGVSTVVSGTTTTAGKVQLTDSTSSTSITTAATPNSVRTAWNLADAAMPKSGGTFTGAVTFAAGQTISGYAALATAQTFTAAQRGTISALGNQSGTITLDMATANNFSLTLNANSTNTLANPSNLTAGQSGCIYISQDATGSRTLAYGSQWDWEEGTAPTLTTTASATDVIVYTVRTTGSIFARLLKNFS